jgi:hypothetical protein
MKVQASQSTAGSAEIAPNAANEADFEMTAYYFPDASLQVIRADQTDYGPTPVTVTGSWTANTTYTATETRRGSMALYRVRVALSGAPNAANLTVNLPAGRTINTSVGSWGADVSPVGRAEIFDSSPVAAYPANVNYSTTTSVIVRAITSGSGVNPVYINTNNIVNHTPNPITFASGDYVDLVFEVPIVGWVSNQGAPQLVNSVISSYIGVAVEEWAVVSTSCTASPCTIASQSSGFTNITRSGTGSYQANFAKNYLAVPACSIQIIGPGNFAANLGAQSVSQVNWNITNATIATNTDSAFIVICKGPR